MGILQALKIPWQLFLLQDSVSIADPEHNILPSEGEELLQRRTLYRIPLLPHVFEHLDHAPNAPHLPPTIKINKDDIYHQDVTIK